MTGQEFIFHTRKTENKHLKGRLYITLFKAQNHIYQGVTYGMARGSFWGMVKLLYPDCGGGDRK